jgi:hypothetical protein
MAHELTDWYEEAERLRVERDALTARLAERDAEIAALRGEITRLRHGYRDVEDTMYLWGSDAAARRIGALLAAVPAPPTANTMPNPWRAELDARIERSVAAFSINPSTLATKEEYQEWQRTRMRLEADAKAALTDYAMREAKNRNGIVSDSPAPPTAATDKEHN